MNRMLSLAEAADVLKVGVPTIQSLINRGLLKSHTHNGEAQVGYEDLVAFLKQDQQILSEHGHHSADLGMIPEN